jgi:tyrosine-protein phosphatase SIW14
MKRTSFLFGLILSYFLAADLRAQTTEQPSSAATPRAEYGEKLRIAGVPNSGKVSERLFRGAQPREPGLLELKKLGITTIVNLRDEDQPKIAWEEKRAETLGIRFVHIPVNGWGTPTSEQVAQFLALFRDNPQEKIFVHCHFGDDRTGVFVASYRMVYEKTGADQALKEMYYFGFNGFWHPSMATFVRDFPARLNTAAILAPFKN